MACYLNETIVLPRPLRVEVLDEIHKLTWETAKVFPLRGIMFSGLP